MTDRIGQQLGNYRLLKHLASGGFAEVYLGEHIYLETNAAIKVLTGQLSPQQGQEFRDEARTIAKIIHPNIVRVLEFGVEQDGTPFLVMDYAPNGTLRNRHPEGIQLSLPVVISYVKQVASAIQAAHNKKIIHRDIKPANMLLGPNDEVWLSDFGIYVIAHSTQSQTRQDLAGSWKYTAPEQFKGKAQPASDQYALGIVVYEWLCGFPPFQGSGFEELYHQHLSVPPPPLHAKLPTIPTQVEQIVLKVLGKDPQQRFASVQEFANALEQASVSSQATTTILPTKQALPTIEPTILAAPQPKSLDPDALYREGVLARSKGDLPSLERAASLWQQILDRDPNYKDGTLDPQMQKLLQELHPLRVQRLRQKAVQASRTGEWDQEISSWNTLLGLESQDTQAKERIPIAEHNQKYAWRYENAQQLVKEGRPDAGRTALQELWQDAPYYGDPAGLAKKVGLPKRPDYEKVKASQARRVEQEHILQFVSISPPNGLGTTPMVVWVCAFCLLSGLSSTIGVFTQSWLWAMATIIVITILSYFIIYWRALGLTTMIGITIVSGATAYILSWYTSTLHHNLIGQLARGLGLGIMISFVLFVPMVFIVKRPFDSLRTFFLIWLSPLLVTVVFEYFLFRGSADLLPIISGSVLGAVSLTGVMCSIYIWYYPRPQVRDNIREPSEE